MIIICIFRANKFTVGDVFIGYDKDTACSVILQISQQLGEDASPIEVFTISSVSYIIQMYQVYKTI